MLKLTSFDHTGPFKSVESHFHPPSFEVVTKIFHTSAPLIPRWDQEDRTKYFENHPAWKSPFLKHIVPQAKKKIVEQIVKLNPSFSEQELCAFEILDLDHAIFQNEEWPYLAFAAYFEDKISRDALAALMQFYSAAKDSSEPVQVHQLTDSAGKVSLEAKKLLIQHIVGKTQCPSVTKRHVEKFIYSLVKEKKPCRFFVSTYNHNPLSTALIDIPFMLSSKDKVTLITLPFYLTTRFYRCLFGSNAVFPHPMLGISNRPPLSQVRSRPVSIGYPEAPSTQIHNIKTFHWSLITAHDLYFHFPILGAIGKEHINLWHELQRAIKQESGKLSVFLLDKAFSLYSKTRDKNLAFFRTLIAILNDILPKMCDTKEQFSKLENSLLSYLRDNQKRLEEQYCLSFTNIHKSLESFFLKYAPNIHPATVYKKAKELDQYFHMSDFENHEEVNIDDE